MTTAGSERRVPIAELGDELSALRLCEPSAVESTRRSLMRHGQLTPLIVYKGEVSLGLEVIDGFKRLRAAQALEWRELTVSVVPIASDIEAKVRIAELHDGRGLTEIEEAWLVYALCREHGLAQGAAAQRLGRHKSWISRRLMLVEALDPAVQVDVRLGLVAVRTAVTLSRLPRGNQPAAAELVVQRGLSVRQTEQLVSELLEAGSPDKLAQVLAAWVDGQRLPLDRDPRRRRARTEAEWMMADIAAICRVSARLQSRLLGTPLLALGERPRELVLTGLDSLEPVLEALTQTIACVGSASRATGAET